MSLLFLTVTGCSLVACSSGDGRGSSSASEGALRKPSSVPSDGGSDAGSDAVAPSTSENSLTIDGAPCSVSSKAVAVDPLNADAWFLRVFGECNTSLDLSVYGMFDGPYPQTNLNPYGIRPATLLFWHREGTLHDDVFGSDVDGGASAVAEGPDRSLHGRVKGVATVASAERGTHVVSYDFSFDR